MNKMILGVSAAAVLGLSSLAGIAPAVAASHDRQDQYIGKFCDNNRGDSRCNDWQQNHNQWGDNQYQGFYRDHRRDSGFGDSAVAALFGFAIGTAVGGTLDNGYGSNHVRACENTYRSYDVQTDTYGGYDGRRHQCLL